MKMMMRRLNVRSFSTSAVDKPKGPWERLKEFVLFRPGAPSWASYPKQAAAGKGYRFPSPASRPHPNIPTVEHEDDLYNTNYYTRDTIRNQRLPTISVSEPLKELPAVHPPELGSKGKRNPAVERYDPTGTRSAMTTSWKAMNAELAKHQPDHFVQPWWQKDPKIYEDALEHAKQNNLPTPIGVARSLGVAKYGKLQW